MSEDEYVMLSCFYCTNVSIAMIYLRYKDFDDYLSSFFLEYTVDSDWKWRILNK